jgi:spoIIIJ-associated protein
MEWVETTGRTVEAALDAALDELGVDEAEVEYEVIEQPRSGLFGRLGGSEARIRARVKPVSREKPGERQRRGRRSGAGQARGGSRPGGSGAPARPSASRDAVPAGAGAGSSDNGSGGSEADVGSTTARRRRRRGGRGRGAGSGAQNGSSGAAGASAGGADGHTSKGNAVETIEPEVTIEEQAEAAEAFTQGLVDAFELGAEARSVIVDGGVLVDVTGAELGLLVGPRGATLNAIEELVRTVVQRQTDGHGVRINVDVGGYRAKRREALAEFTRGIAARVIETDRPQALEPMSASDRKVVHDTVAEIDGVATESEGEEPRRRVVVVPADAATSEAS